MDERMRFVARLLDGEKMTVLCREFGISRKTGYKIYARYQDWGLRGLTDRSRRPYRQACRLPAPIESLILELKREHPSWGAPKIREKIRRKQAEIRLPAHASVRLGSFSFRSYCIHVCICLVFASLLSVTLQRLALR
jgi:putative transposase